MLYFECGLVILSQSSSLEKIEKTLDNISKQTYPFRKVCVVVLNKDMDISKKWISDKNTELKKIGIQDFTVAFVSSEDPKLSHCIQHAYKTVINKPMSITIDTKDGKKKTKIRVSHFAVIREGEGYSSNDLLMDIRERCFSEEKVFCYYFNIESSDGFCKVNINDLDDSYPAIFYSYGFRFFIHDINEIDSIMETYRKIRITRMRKKQEDIMTHDDDLGYDDIVFKKTTGYSVVEL